MVAKRFEAIFARFQASKRLVAVAVGALLLGAVGGLFSIPLEHSLDVMLPVNSEARQTISFLNEIDFSTKVLISMARASGALDQQAFMAEVDAFSESIDSPLVTQTLSRFDQSGAMHDIAFFLARVPDLFDEAAQTQLEEQLTPDEVGAALRRKYVQLLKPEGSFMGAMIRRDPLDMQMAIAERLRGLSTAFGYDMHIEDGHIMSADGDHALIVLETTVPFTDAAGSRELIQMLDGYMDSVPDGIAFDVVCGHLHTLGNEKVIRRDIGWTVGIAGTAFVLLFLFFFKDARANLVFLLPFATLPIAVNMTALVFGSLSPMMLGFGSVIAGITVDYAIHVYIAVRRGSDALEAVRSVARPVLLGAVTTGAVFAAFLSSSIPGYHQLACFALCSVVIAVVGALFVLPLYLVPGTMRGLGAPVSRWPRGRAWLSIALFCMVVGVLMPAACKVRFASNIEQLDGAGENVAEMEARFHDTWGGGQGGQGIAAVGARDREEALALNDRLYHEVASQFDDAQLANLSRIWKSSSQRLANIARWQSFWSAGRQNDLQALFREKGDPLGFSPEAFDPFFKSLASPPEFVPEPAENQIFTQLADRFIQKVDGKVWVLSFFPDSPAAVTAIDAARASIPDMVLVSHRALTGVLARDYTREFARIGIVALALVLVATMVLLRDLRQSLIVLLPACSGVLGVIALASLLGIPLNVMNLVSGIVVIGLCIDYGIFYVHAYVHGLDLGTRSAISLSAGTTLIGAAALLFAHHPALFSVGLTLVGGIAAGYATSMLVVPALCSIWLKERA